MKGFEEPVRLFEVRWRWRQADLMDAPRIQYAKTEDGVSIAYWAMAVARSSCCLPC